MRICLSKMQRYVLEKAAATPDCLYFAEILTGFFGWETDRPIRLTSGELDSGYRFSKRLIGEKLYRRVMATVSRSCRRLEELGLVKRHCWSSARGVKITPKGRQLLIVKRIQKQSSTN
jgi:hypothetical protein